MYLTDRNEETVKTNKNRSQLLWNNMEKNRRLKNAVIVGNEFSSKLVKWSCDPIFLWGFLRGLYFCFFLFYCFYSESCLPVQNTILWIFEILFEPQELTGVDTPEIFDKNKPSLMFLKWYFFTELPNDCFIGHIEFIL